MNKSNFTKEAEAKLEARNKAKKESQPKRTPWYIKALMALFDVIAAISILALAIIGARHLVAGGVTEVISYGIAAFVVGLLATRLLERVFQSRR